MKLYATTRSERASKGQGGNDFLRVSLTVGNSSEPADAGMIEVLEVQPNVFEIFYRFMGKSKSINKINTNGTIFATKGNKQ